MFGIKRKHESKTPAGEVDPAGEKEITMTLEILYAFSVAPVKTGCVPLMGLTAGELTFARPCSHELIELCVLIELVHEGYKGRTILDES